MIDKDRIRELIAQMSAQEKVPEMSQLRGENPDGTLMGLEQGIHKDLFPGINTGPSCTITERSAPPKHKECTWKKTVTKFLFYS